jgi:hypothetical protein
MTMQEAPRRYREFWPIYVRAHTRVGTQRMHLLATIVGATCSFAGLANDEMLSVPLGIAVAFAIALASHRMIEGNWPTAGRHPLWSAMADLEMCALLVTGRMGAEMRRLEVPAAEPRRGHRVQPAC